MDRAVAEGYGVGVDDPPTSTPSKPAPSEPSESGIASEIQADRGVLFAVFNEIAIIEQLARTQLEAVMPDGLLLPHFGVLNHLVRLGDDKPLNRLAFAFQVTKGTMTNTIQRLERRGYVVVRPDPSDGRGKRVFITEEGRAVRETAIAALGPMLDALAKKVEPAVFASILPHLSHLRAVLDEMRNPPAPS
ncbi:MAG: MarR family transcriptional regulator [Pseudomonadota bacterium]